MDAKYTSQVSLSLWLLDGPGLGSALVCVRVWRANNWNTLANSWEEFSAKYRPTGGRQLQTSGGERKRAPSSRRARILSLASSSAKQRERDLDWGAALRRAGRFLSLGNSPTWSSN